MCGIAGLAHDAASPPCPLPVLEALADALTHRGQAGAPILCQPRARLASHRLTTILSAAPHVHSRKAPLSLWRLVRPCPRQL